MIGKDAMARIYAKNLSPPKKLGVKKTRWGFMKGGNFSRKRGEACFGALGDNWLIEELPLCCTALLCSKLFSPKAEQIDESGHFKGIDS